MTQDEHPGAKLHLSMHFSLHGHLVLLKYFFEKQLNDEISILIYFYKCIFFVI